MIVGIYMTSMPDFGIVRYSGNLDLRIGAAALLLDDILQTLEAADEQHTLVRSRA